MKEIFRGEIFGVPVDFIVTHEPGKITVSWLQPPMEFDPATGVLKVWPVPLEKSAEEEKEERWLRLLGG